MKQKYLILSMVLFFFLILSSATSLALIPGDFGSVDNGPPDGVVDFEDLMLFAMAYGTTPADANWNPLCDIYPDGIIDFEDLMIFALHYGECAPPSIHNLTKNTYYNSIQVALDDADTYNTIEVADGTYDESITFPSDKVIILQSVNGASSTIIRGNDGSYTVTFSGSLTGTTLEGFTITHTEGSAGSGVYIVNSNLTINECTISGNTGITGAGIYNRGTLTITLSTISGNTATDCGGGGIYNSVGRITITLSTISGNTANYGGGIDSYAGTLDITSSTISGNDVTFQGGGIYLEGTATITIGGNDASDTSNFNTFTDNKKDGIISAAQHICNFGGDCRSSYPNNYYNPN
jgi:parallel beta-helix repeat protein